MSELQQTPLHGLHRELGARLVPFAGWSMPVQYPAGGLAEHRHCREKAALFDVSHMGQVRIPGERAAAALERLVPAAVTGLPPGRARYTVLTNEAGGIIDDLIVANAGDGLFLVVNASRRAVDLAHLRAHIDGVEELADRALLALQGPAAAAVLARLAPEAAGLPFMGTAEMDVGGLRCRVSRLGYTGEDGFEIAVPADRAAKLARTLLAAEEVEPAGLGARDTLRLEAGLALYGHEIDETTSPVEAGLAWSIPRRRREAGGFLGDAVILAQLRDGTARRLTGFVPAGRAIAREGAAVVDGEGRTVGRVTSGGFGPTVNAPVAMGYVETALAAAGAPLHLVVRERPHPAVARSLPFVAHRYHR